MPPPVAFDRDVLGNRQAWKAAKEYYEAVNFQGPRIKVYGSDFLLDEYVSVGDGEYVHLPGMASSPEGVDAEKDAREDEQRRIIEASGLPNYSVKLATSPLPNGWRKGYLLRSESVTPRAFASREAAEEIADRLRQAGFEAETVKTRGWHVAARERRNRRRNA